MSRMCFDNTIFPQMNRSIHIVLLFLNIRFLSIKSQRLEDMFISRDSFKNTLDHCDLGKVNVVIYKFPELSRNMLTANSRNRPGFCCHFFNYFADICPFLSIDR